MAQSDALLKRIERGVRNLVRGLPGAAWEACPYVSDASPVIVGGCGRSGTTLLSVILNSHPNLCCGPESRLFTTPGLNPKRISQTFDFPPAQIKAWARQSGSRGEFIERFFDATARREGKRRWAEKTPGNILVLDRIFAWFPRAKFIHAIRDGRDCMCSNRTHPKMWMKRGKMVPTGIRRPIEECAQRWVDYVGAGLAHRDDDRYFEVRYEDVVNHPEATIRGLLEFIGEPWDDAVMNFQQRDDRLTKLINLPGKPIYTSAMARWKNDLTGEEVDTVKRMAGDLLTTLGYADGDNWGLDDQADATPELTATEST